MVSDKILAENISSQLGGGYWQVNGQYFFSKIDCLRYASQIKKYDVTFHYHDEFYKSLSWNNEPSEPLEELYRRRAQQLRDKYDYIILSFSGGSDSYNILDIFLKNKIHIDCIATSYPIQAIEKLQPYFNPADDSAGNLIFEYSQVAHPKLLEVAKLSPKTEIAVLDYTDTAINMIGNNKLHAMPVGGIGLAPGLAGHYMIGQKVRQYAEKGTAVYLTGVDKPKIGFNPRTKKFGTYFEDISLVLGKYTKEAFDGYNPIVEHFYYTTDMPEVWQKQLHIFKRALEPMIHSSEDMPEAVKRLMYLTPKDNYIFYVHNMFFKKLLYKDWNESFFQAKKPSGFFFQENSDWYLKSNLVGTRAKDYHHGQVMDLLSDINPRFIDYDHNGKPLQFKGLSTQPIPIS
jgi:hypothetical protein